MVLSSLTLRRCRMMVMIVVGFVCLIELTTYLQRFVQNPLDVSPSAEKFTKLGSHLKTSDRDNRQLTVTRSSDDRRFHGYAVNIKGTLLQRVRKFNDAVGQIRDKILTERGGVAGSSGGEKSWNDSVLKVVERKFIWGGDDNYTAVLAKKHKHITTVVLPWFDQTEFKKQGVSDPTAPKWNSLTDQSNVLIQNYYRWTGDDQLCKWIESPGTIKMKYDSVFDRKCSRDLESDATTPQSLETLYFYNKPINRNQYWPNNGDSYPRYFYTDPPPFPLYVHIHRNAVVDGNGDVFSGDTSLAMYVCRDSSNPPTSALPKDARTAPYYDEVFSVGQMWGSATFHRMVEVVPRLGTFVDFLRANPTVRIHGEEKAGGRLGEILRIFGIDDKRLVQGTVRASIIYQPRETGCGMASVVEAQLTSKMYRDHIAKNLQSSSPSNRPKRNRLVLIRRSGGRHFTQHDEIERRLKAVASEFKLVYELFPDDPTPSFNNTMLTFNAALMVVGPHGAGLSNIFFSEPGTFVIEGVCNLPHVNLCFQRLAHVLGHRYYGIASRGGCEGHVDVDAADIEKAARSYLAVSQKIRVLG